MDLKNSAFIVTGGAFGLGGETARMIGAGAAQV